MRGSKYGNRTGMALAYMGSTPLFLLIGGYLVYYYTAILGLDGAILGTILLVSRVFDGISDIVFGNIIDHTKTRFGICVPWVASMTAASVAAILLLLNVPLGSAHVYVYIFIVYNLSTTGISTIFQLAIVALPSYITRDSDERSQLYIWANTGQMITQTIISSTLLRITEYLGGDQKAWVLTFVGLGVIGAVLICVSLYLCRETVDLSKLSGQSSKMTLKIFVSDMASCVKNKYWWLLLAIVILATSINITTVNIVPYYGRYVLGSVGKADTLNMFYSLPMMLVVPVVGIVVGRLGKKNISLIGAVMIIVGCIISAVLKTDFTGLIVSTVIRSMGIGCITAVCAPMLTDAIEYGEWRNGTRNQAVLIGAQSAGTKIGEGITMALLSWAITFLGFEAEVVVQSQAVESGIISLYSLVPIVLAAATVFLLLIYDLDKRLPDILKELESREQKLEEDNLTI